MKTYTTTLFAAVIFFLVIIAASFSFVGDVPVKNILTAQYQAIQEKDRGPTVRDQEAEKQSPNTKDNSFYAGKVLGREQGNLNDTKAKVNRGKNYLLTQVDNRVGQLGPFRDRIGSMATLNNSDKKSLVSELNTEIDVFGALKAEISRSATKEDVKNVADKVKAEWIKSRRSVERAEATVLVSKENQLVLDASAASLGIQKRIDVLKAQGKDAKPYETLFSAYRKKIASAKQDLESAKVKSSTTASTLTNDEKEKLIKGNNLLLTSAQNNIKDAYKILKEEAQQEFSRRFK
jgi:hypothetical protein